MTSWDQARRVLNPGELLSQVRMLTLQSFTEQILQKVQETGIAQPPFDPNYLQQLEQQNEVSPLLAAGYQSQKSVWFLRSRFEA